MKQMKHTHVHTDESDGVLWIDQSGQLRASNSYAQHQIDQFGRSGFQGQELLNFIIQKLDPATMVGTTECEDPSHIPTSEADGVTGESSTDPAPDDHWEDYQGEDERRHNDVSFSNDISGLH